MVNELVEPPVRRFCFFMILYTDDAECASIFGLRPWTKIKYKLIRTDLQRTVLRSSYCNNNFKIGSKIDKSKITILFAGLLCGGVGGGGIIGSTTIVSCFAFSLHFTRQLQPLEEFGCRWSFN